MRLAFAAQAADPGRPSVGAGGIPVFGRLRAHRGGGPVFPNVWAARAACVARGGRQAAPWAGGSAWLSGVTDSTASGETQGNREVRAG